jgi:hypothetical protein
VRGQSATEKAGSLRADFDSKKILHMPQVSAQRETPSSSNLLWPPGGNRADQRDPVVEAAELDQEEEIEEIFSQL